MSGANGWCPSPPYSGKRLSFNDYRLSIADPIVTVAGVIVKTFRDRLQEYAGATGRGSRREIRGESSRTLALTSLRRSARLGPCSPDWRCILRRRGGAAPLLPEIASERIGGSVSTPRAMGLGPLGEPHHSSQEVFMPTRRNSPRAPKPRPVVRPRPPRPFRGTGPRPLAGRRGFSFRGRLSTARRGGCLGCLLPATLVLLAAAAIVIAVL